MALNEAIKQRMRKLNVGNKELSEKSGVALGTLNNILGGITQSPSIDNVMAIAQALGCTVDDFISDTEKSNRQGYYIDDEAAEIAQEMFERQELRVLFDASRNVSKEDILSVANILEKLKEQEE